MSTQPAMSTTIRVNPDVYARLLRHKQALERAQTRSVSMSDAVADLLKKQRKPA